MELVTQRGKGHIGQGRLLHLCSDSVLPEGMGIIAVAFCYDPSGNVVELIELAPGFQQTDLDACLSSGQQD